MQAYQKRQIQTFRQPEKVNIDDIWCDAELAQCKAERENQNGSNGDQPGRVTCQCVESIINGRRIPVHRPEDCQYSEARSALVPIAEQIATESVGNKRGIVNGYRWTRRFVAEMEKLAAPLLKQSGNGADSLS